MIESELIEGVIIERIVIEGLKSSKGLDAKIVISIKQICYVDHDGEFDLIIEYIDSSGTYKLKTGFAYFNENIDMFYLSRMHNDEYEESMPPLLRDIVRDNFPSRIITTYEIRRLTNNFSIPEHDYIIYSFKEFTETYRQLEENNKYRYFQIERTGYTIKISRESKLSIISNEIVEDIGECSVNIKPTSNRGIIFWYDYISNCKECNMFEESILSVLELETLDQCIDYLDNL